MANGLCTSCQSKVPRCIRMPGSSTYSYRTIFSMAYKTYTHGCTYETKKLERPHTLKEFLVSNICRVLLCMFLNRSAFVFGFFCMVRLRPTGACSACRNVLTHIRIPAVLCNVLNNAHYESVTAAAVLVHKLHCVLDIVEPGGAAKHKRLL